MKTRPNQNRRSAGLPGLLLVALLVTGCSSPDSSLRALTQSGRDGRIYNPQTGRYEWPEEERVPQQPRRSRTIGSALRDAEAPAPAADDERTYDIEARQFR